MAALRHAAPEHERELSPLTNLDDFRVLHRQFMQQGLRRLIAEHQAQLAPLEALEAQAKKVRDADRFRRAEIRQMRDDSERIRAMHKWIDKYERAITLLAQVRTLRSRIKHAERMLNEWSTP